MKKIMIAISVATVVVGAARAAMFPEEVPWLAILGFYLLGVLGTYHFILWRNNTFDGAHASCYRHAISVPAVRNQKPVEPCDGLPSTPLEMQTDPKVESARVENEVRTGPVASGDLILNQPDIEFARREGAERIAVEFQRENACDIAQRGEGEVMGTPTEAAEQNSAKRFQCSADAQQLVDERDCGPIREKSPVEVQEATNASRNSEVLAVLNDDRRTCPKCGADWVAKRVKKGTNAGSLYWGCSTYPRCRYRVTRAASEKKIITVV